MTGKVEGKASEAEDPEAEDRSEAQEAQTRPRPLTPRAHLEPALTLWENR